MGRADYYADGQWNVICDQCGFKCKSKDIKKQWDGLEVCKRCWEPRQPQDFVRGVMDRQQVPFTRPDVDPTFTPGAQALPLPDNELIMSFTVGGSVSESGLFQVAVGNATALTYYVVIGQPTSLSIGLVSDGAVVYLETPTTDGANMVGDYVIEHDETTAYFNLNGELIGSTDYIAPPSLDIIAQDVAAPTTLTNLQIGT